MDFKAVADQVQISWATRRILTKTIHRQQQERRREWRKDEAHRMVTALRFRSNEVRLWLSLIAYNLGNLWRRLALPKGIGNWSLTSPCWRRAS
jgi:hypothetical protein